jgi:hypothetical protein
MFSIEFENDKQWVGRKEIFIGSAPCGLPSGIGANEAGFSRSRLNQNPQAITLLEVIKAFAGLARNINDGALHGRKTQRVVEQDTLCMLSTP